MLRKRLTIFNYRDMKSGLRPDSNSRPRSQTETTSNMRGPMTIIGTIKPSGDKEALYHKLVYTTTTARVILCKCWWTFWNWAVVSPIPRFRCQNNHREGPNIFLWVRVDYDQINSLEVWHRTGLGGRSLAASRCKTPDPIDYTKPWHGRRSGRHGNAPGGPAPLGTPPPPVPAPVPAPGTGSTGASARRRRDPRLRNSCTFWSPGGNLMRYDALIKK